MRTAAAKDGWSEATANATYSILTLAASRRFAPHPPPLSAVNYKAKITPPRIKPPGTKVGCLSTRTPHRPNNVGLSLLKLQSVSKSTITVTGVDLCDKVRVGGVKEGWSEATATHSRPIYLMYVPPASLSLSRTPLARRFAPPLLQTPIYDIKPFVPWDVPGYVSGGSWEGEMLDVIRCPDWVWDPAASSSLSTSPPPVLSPSLNPGSTVDWTSESLTDLQSLVSKGTFSPLYPKKSPTSFELVKAAVTEILLQDPRHNRQKGTKTGSDGYKIVFCEATVTFCVEEGGARVIEVKEAEWEDGDDGRMRFMKKK